MSIQAINYVTGLNYYKKEFVKQNHRPSFQGYVNGNYYKDEIIRLAKKYQYSSDWKECLRREKKTAGDAIKNWHHKVDWGQDGDYDNVNRILSGVLSIGMTEVLMSSGAVVSNAYKNNKIEHTINEVAKCIDDLRHEK